MKKILSSIIFFVLFVFSAVPILWFLGKGNILIDGVDTNFPLDPAGWFGRRLFVWNAVTNAGVDFSSSVAGLFFHLIQVIPYKLGASLHDVQMLSLIFWFSMIVFAAFVLAKQIVPRRPLVQLLFVNLYAFNIYLFNTWENIKVTNLSLMAGMPLALAVLLLLRNGKIKRLKAALYSIPVGIIISGTGINPAYLICFYFILAIYLISELLSLQNNESIVPRIKDFLVVTSVIFLINFFWILPTANFILKNIPSGGSIDRLGFNNWVDSLSENTSLLNIMRMQGAWDWYAFDSVTGLPLYIPYALNYFYNNWFVIFSFLITGISISALFLINKKKRHLYLAFGLMLALGAFLGAGTHLPTGDAFRFLLNNLPFFTLFRSPWYIFTPLMILSLAGLVSLFFDRLFDFYEVSKTTNKPRVNLIAVNILHFSVVILIIGNLLYSYPLVTGKIFRPDQPNNFLVKFPSYIFDAKDWLSKDGTGRIIGYPDNEIEEFQWGYRGIESILSLLVDREVLFSPLNAPDAPVAGLIKEFYLNLKKGQIDSAKAIAAKLNIGLIFEKKDQKSITLPLPPQIKDLPNKTFGNWTFYEFPDKNTSKKISATLNLYSIPLSDSDKNFISALGSDDLVLNSEDKVVGQIPGINNIANSIVLSKNSQLNEFMDFELSESRLSNRLITRNLSTVEFSFVIPEDGIYQPLIEKYHLQDFGIDLSKGLNLEIDGKKTFWETNFTSDSYLYLAPTAFSKGKHKVILSLDNKNLINGGNLDSGVTFEKGGEGKGEGIYEIDDSTKDKFLSITNIDKADISADFKVASFNPLVDYYVEVKYKQIYGNNTNILVRQSNKNTLFKAQVERMPNHPEWKLASFYYQPVQVDSDMTVELLAPHVSDPLGTKILYDDLKVYKVFSNKLLFIDRNDKQNKQLSRPQINLKKISPVEYEAEVFSADKPYVIVFSENYSPDWKLEVLDMNGKLISLKQLHFTANLYANAWYVDGAPNAHRLRITYSPQSWFLVGLLISGLSIISIISLYLKKFMHK